MKPEATFIIAEKQGEEYVLAKPPVGYAIKLSANNIVYLMLKPDGTLWVSPDLKPNKAAKLFIEALKGPLMAMYKASRSNPTE